MLLIAYNHKHQIQAQRVNNNQVDEQSQLKAPHSMALDSGCPAVLCGVAQNKPGSRNAFWKAVPPYFLRCVVSWFLMP